MKFQYYLFVTNKIVMVISKFYVHYKPAKMECLERKNYPYISKFDFIYILFSNFEKWCST